MPQLGSTRPNAGTVPPLQLEEPVADLRTDYLEPVVFLRHLLQRIPGRLLIVWDGLAAHRSKLVKEYVAGLEGRIHLERLPAYAPELNPVEYVWAHLKQHELPNVCAKDLWSLGELARKKLRRMRRRKPLLTACWKQSSLTF